MGEPVVLMVGTGTIGGAGRYERLLRATFMELAAELGFRL
jgi:hypothetical protein